MSLPQTKKCSTCEETKPAEGFHKDRSQKDGLQHRCKPCGTEAHRAWRRNNPASAKATRRRQLLKYKYDMTEGCFEALWDNQEGVCSICGCSLARDAYGHAIDHNHITNEVRSILCHGCNTGLGMFKDSPQVLDRASAYLKSYGYYGPTTEEGETSPAQGLRALRRESPEDKNQRRHHRPVDSQWPPKAPCRDYRRAA